MRIQSWIAGAGVSLCFAGCDARAGSNYQGESLLSLRGQVVIQSSAAPAELVPAIAFLDNQQTFHILDVDVHGEFPADFQLDVLDPPPAAALRSPAEVHFDGKASDARYAYGLVSAVTPQHPALIRGVSASLGELWCDGDPVSRSGEGSPPKLGSPPLTTQPGFSCFRETKACTYDGSECVEYSERCDHDFESCEVESTVGAADLIDRVTKSFAGISPGYVVLYLEGPAQAGSAVARVFARGKALSFGYHLLKVTDFPTDEEWSAAAEQCVHQATALVADRYNAVHGTSYGTFDDLPRMYAEGTPEAGGLSNRVENDEVDDLLASALRELQCPLSASYVEPVTQNNPKLSLVIGSNFAPPDIGT